MEVTNLNLRIGPYELHSVPTGEFGLDGGAMFGTVPKVLWEKSNPADEKNRIRMEARGLLLKSSHRNVLIDTGNGGDFVAKYGPKLGGKFAEMYGVNSGGPSLLGSLRKHGLSPEDITDVILTHLHFDHAGGATTEKDSKLVPTFPKARYFVQKENLLTAQTPNLRERASYFPANFQPLLESGALTLLEGAGPLEIPGFSSHLSFGHTKAHQMVKISDGTQSLLYCGDVVPTSSHVRLAWVMGYDLEPLRLIQEKTEILSQAAEGGWHLFFEHDPYCDTAKIRRDGSDFAVESRYWLQ